MHLIAGAVEEAGVDEGHAGRGGGNTGLEIYAGTALFVHDAELDGMAWQLEEFLDPTEQFVGKGNLRRTVHLRLDDIDAATTGIALALQVVARDQRGHHRIENSLGDFVAGLVENRGVGHQVPHVAHEQQGAAMEDHRLAVAASVFAVGVQAAGDGLAALLELVDQRTLHQAQPVAIDDHLVVGIDRRDGVLTVHDGRKRRLDQQIVHTRGVRPTDRPAAVDLDLDVKAVVPQQDRIRRGGVALEADETGPVGQSGHRTILERDPQCTVTHGIRDRIRMRGSGKRCRLIEHRATECDDLLAAHRIVVLATGGTVGIADRIGAIERIIERAPAGIGRIQGVARIHYRHHKLRAGLHRQLVVHVGGADLHILGNRHQIADRFQECAVSRHVAYWTGIGAMPCIEFALQAIPLGEQRLVLGRQVMHQLVEAGPEARYIEAGSRQGFFIDEALQIGGNLQSLALGTFGHGSGSLIAKTVRSTRSEGHSSSVWPPRRCGGAPRERLFDSARPLQGSSAAADESENRSSCTIALNGKCFHQ